LAYSQHPSRRLVVTAIAQSAAALLVCARGQAQSKLPQPAAPLPATCDAPDDDGLRASSNYVDVSPFGDANDCRNCDLWVAPKAGAACGGCTLLSGPISPVGYCDSWALVGSGQHLKIPIPPAQKSQSPTVATPRSAVLAVGMAMLALVGAGHAADDQLGFVVSKFAYALSRDADQTGACPDGMTSGYKNYGDVFISMPELQRQEGELEDKYLRRVYGTAMRDSNTRNLCQNPELGKPDPLFRTVSGAKVPADGIDLDGQVSTAKGKAAANKCAHDDFVGIDGEPGIDNQFFRVVGCSKSYQSTGPSNAYETEMLTGAWGVLITLKGVDDRRNDNDVEVGIFANADPIELSPTRLPLPNATYAVDQDLRFRAVTHGRIVDGVLTTDPVDVRFHKVTNSIRLERPLRDARMRMTFTPDGGLEGILAGYTNVDDIYDFQYAYRNGKDGTGNLAPLPLRTISSIGQSLVLGHTCNGAYYALKQMADGHRDPKTQQCTSISTQYRLQAIPAFVVDTATESVNATLGKQPDKPLEIR
jgi:hypothetical protein